MKPANVSVPAGESSRLRLVSLSPAAPVAWTLKMLGTGTPEEYRVLSYTMNMRPYANVVAQRIAHVSVELIDDHWVENLDPDGLAMVINTLAERLDGLREAHTRLIEVRAQYLRQVQA